MLDHYISTVFANGFKAQIVGVSRLLTVIRKLSMSSSEENSD